MTRLVRASLALTLLAGAAALAPGPVRAEPAPPLPSNVTVDGQALVLNGAGVRVFFMMVNGYRTGLYLRAPAHDATSILAEPRPIEIRTVFLHGATTADLRGELNRIHDSYCARNPCPAADQAAYQDLLAHEAPVRAGDTETLVIDQQGIAVSRDGATAHLIDDPHFGVALLASMIGPSAPTAGFRRGLLGLRG